MKIKFKINDIFYIAKWNKFRQGYNGCLDILKGQTDLGEHQLYVGVFKKDDDVSIKSAIITKRPQPSQELKDHVKNSNYYEILKYLNLLEDEIGYRKLVPIKKRV